MQGNALGLLCIIFFCGLCVSDAQAREWKVFAEQEIRTALKDFEAVNGRCTQDTPEMVRRILGKPVQLTYFELCTTSDEAVAAIKKVFPEHKLVVYWPEHGFGPGGVPVKHGFIIFSVDPLLSFTAYDGKPAHLSFFDEKQTLERIRNTVQSAPHGKYVDVNRIVIGAKNPKRAEAGCRKSSQIAVQDAKNRPIRFTPKGNWQKDWQTTMELADNGSGTLSIAGVRLPCGWVVENKRFVVRFANYGTTACEIINSNNFLEIPTKAKWSRMKANQPK
jgi:hypothetical protein